MRQQKLVRERVIVYTLSLLVLLGSLAGCSLKKQETPSSGTSMTKQKFYDSLESENNPVVEQSESSFSQTEEETDFPGTYTVPDGWVKAEQYSSEDKIFYVKEGHEEEMPDNISIEIGTNRYSLEEHEQFRTAILRQLSMQVSGSDAQITGSGTTTAQGCILYIFTIKDDNIVTKQYYIVGERRYCLIHSTNFTGAESINEAAKALADSFVWNDLEE